MAQTTRTARGRCLGYLLVLAASLAALLAACTPGVAVRRHFELRREGGTGLAATESLPWLCREGSCTVAREVWLDERDVRGATFLDRGEATAAVVLHLSDDGAARLALAVRSNQGQNLAIVQDARVLATWLATTVSGGPPRQIELIGDAKEMKRVYDQLTQPPR
jgi:hypothetical protein